MSLHKFIHPFLRYFRGRRINFIYEKLGIQADSKVLDLGGNMFWWQLADEKALPVPEVTIVNIIPRREDIKLSSNFRWVVYDGVKIPFEDNSFDIGFCNSVIEHVGDWERQCQFASELKRVCKKFYIQTPDRNSPFEYHTLSLFIHWLPRNVQWRLYRYFTLWGLLMAPTVEVCKDRAFNDLFLLDPHKFKQLFPEGILYRERFLGIPKSLYIIKA